MVERFDVVVTGGGPAGSVCACSLVQRGHHVLVLEKERFPRFRLGESLLPGSIPVFDEIGVLEEIERRFLKKLGAQFHDDQSGRRDRFAFSGAWRPEPGYAFQVPRDELDMLLLARARLGGADVREGWSVTRVAHGEVHATSPEGEARRIEARFVVDATGREALSARADKRAARIEGLDQTALFTQFTGVPRGEGDRAGDIDIVLFPDETGRPNWFWFIPFADGRASVGAVVSQAWMRARRGPAPDLFAAAVEASPTAARLLASARPIWPVPRATADFSYRVAARTEGGLLRIGDAAGFVDPLFSSGVHLAVVGAARAAEVIAAVFADGSRAPALLAEWDAFLGQGIETFVDAVRAFYAGPLVDTLFAEDKHDALRRSVTSLLAGDVFGDAVWLRDARRRIRAMTDDQASF